MENIYPADLDSEVPQEHPQLISLWKLRHVSQKTLDQFNTKHVKAQKARPALLLSQVADLTPPALKGPLFPGALLHSQGWLVPPSIFPEDTEHQRQGHCLRSDHCIGTAASQPWPLGPTSHTQSVLVAAPSTEKLHFSCSCAFIFSAHNHQSFWLSLAHHSRMRMLGQTEPVRTRSLVLGWWGQVGINCLSYAISCSSR